MFIFSLFRKDKKTCLSKSVWLLYFWRLHHYENSIWGAMPYTHFPKTLIT